MHEMKMTRRLWRALAVARKREERYELEEAQKQTKSTSVEHLDQLYIETSTKCFFAGPQLFASWLKTFAP
jgi:hypothetical protein